MATSPKEMKKGLTTTVKSPFTGFEYTIRKSSGIDYLALDYLPQADPTSVQTKEEKELLRKEVEKQVEGDLALRIRVERDMVIRCVIEPKVVDKPHDQVEEDEVHVDLLAPDIDWLFTTIDDFSRGPKSGNPTTDSGV